jgi:5-methylcytosine-specific restriction endonuclease McrA
MNPKKVNFLYCEYCGWKSTNRDISKLKINKLDEDKFKCPNCGRLINLKLIEDHQKKLDLENNNNQKKEEFDSWIKENFKE